MGNINLPSSYSSGYIKTSPFADITINLGPPSPSINRIKASITPLKYNLYYLL